MLFICIFPCTTGVPGRPEITGFTKPAMEGDVITLTCTTTGSKPAANIRWFRNDKEVQGKHVVWISQSIVSSVTTYTLLETSLLSSHSASLCAHIHALFHWPGGLAVPWFAWLIASIAAVVGTCPNAAGLWRSCPHFTTWPRWRHIVVPLIDSNYKIKCTSTRSCVQHFVFPVSGTKVIMYWAGWLIETRINHTILKAVIKNENADVWVCSQALFSIYTDVEQRSSETSPFNS